MSSTDYNYDEQGQFFPFFILTLTSLVTLPVSYNLFKPTGDLINTAPRIQSDFRPAHHDIVQKQKQKLLRKQRRIKRTAFVIIGYTIMAYMVYLIIVTARTMPKIWDPYDVLGVSRSADEKAIGRHYKRMSLLYHPDKARPDPAKNETLQDLNDRYIELTKAYKALTDEEIRNNYLMYGHPDGKQSFSIGIALPKLIVTEGYGKYVLLVYGALLGVLLPYVVGKWWYGFQRYTKDKVLVDSASNLFLEFDDSMTSGDIVTALSTGEEFKGILAGDKAESGLSKVEMKVTNDEFGMGPAERKALSDVEDPLRRKTLALLWAYLKRIDLEDAELNNEKYEIAPTAFTLNGAFQTISLAFDTLAPIVEIMRMSQSIIQAIPPKASPLLQLPYFTPEIARAVEKARGTVRLSVQNYMEIPADQRKKFSIGPDLLTEQQYETAVSVANQLPFLVVEKAFFKVVGEKIITPSSLIQFVVKARFIPPGSANVPKVIEKDLEDADPNEDDLDQFLGRKISSESEPQATQPPLAFAPYFARDHSPRWHIFLADPSQNKIAVPPFTFSTFDKPIFDEHGKPTYNMQTLKMSFHAPPSPGQFKFAALVVCDSYVGFDAAVPVVLSIEDPQQMTIEEDDISEPDEDSIAGQMHALKTGQPPAPKKTAVSSSDENDESGTDEDVDDTSTTDTETDTDGE